MSVFGFAFVGIGLRQNAQQLRANIKQQQALIFLEYTKRYHDICGENLSIISSYPYQASYTQHEKKIYVEFIPKLNSLIHQEHFLYRQGMISSEIWNLWTRYFKNDVRTEEFRKFWNETMSRRDADQIFVKFVNDLIAGQNTTHGH